MVYSATSASIGNKYGIYEPVHGSAPDIAGQNIANPIAAILSLGMLFKYSLQLDSIHDLIESAVSETLNAGFRTKDIGIKDTLTCSQMGDEILKNIDKLS